MVTPSNPLAPNEQLLPLPTPCPSLSKDLLGFCNSDLLVYVLYVVEHQSEFLNSILSERLNIFDIVDRYDCLPHSY